MNTQNKTLPLWELPDIDARNTGLADAVMAGWFRNKSKELFKGFPIDDQDIVADIGCGAGGATLFCARQGAHVIFTDPEESTVKALAERLKSTPARKVEAYVSDSNPLQLPDAVANKVIAQEVMEHVDDPSQFMRELVRIGKPGALFLITVPAAESEFIQKDIVPPSYHYFEKPNHIRIFQHDQIKNIIERSGLTIKKSFKYGFFWTVWWSLFWACKEDTPDTQHPVLVNWVRSWDILLKMGNGPKIKKALDNACPKSYGFIARKAG